MSNFSKQGVEKATEASALIQINKFMERETAENLERLRDILKLSKAPSLSQG